MNWRFARPFQCHLVPIAPRSWKPLPPQLRKWKPSSDGTRQSGFIFPSSGLCERDGGKQSDMESREPGSRVYVGQAWMMGSVARYARSFDLLEVPGDPGRHPGRKVLRQWRERVPDDFVFSVLVPTEVARLESGGTDELAQAAEAFEILRAGWWVLRTPPAVTPSPGALRRLEALIGRLRGPGRKIAWEPRGVWSEEDLSRAARSLDVHIVRDLTREETLPRGEAEVYTRVRALGEGMRVGASAAERLAERLSEATTAYVVIEGSGAGRVRKVLQEALGMGGTGGTSGDEQTFDEETFEDDADDDEEAARLEEE